MVEIVDGYALSGTIGGVAAGYLTGTTTMLIDTISIALPNGTTFVNNATTHTISGSVGGTTPTSITFAPGLTAGVADNAVLTFAIAGPAVDNVAGYAIGVGTVAVSGFSGPIPNGTPFKFSGHATVYTVGSTTGGSTPTSITFTPTLTAAVIDDEVTTLQPTAAVNRPSTGPANGASTVLVSGFTQSLTNGMQFSVDGSDLLYTILSTAGGATPTSVSFTPSFSTTAGIPSIGSALVIGPHNLEVKIGEGTLTYNEKRNMEYTRNRRVVAFVKTGDDEPMEVSFDFIWEFLKSGTGETITIEEALKGKANAVAAGWVTSGSDPCEPYATDIRITYIPPCPGVDREVITLKEYRWEGGNHDLKAGTVASTGKCKISEADLLRAAS